MQSLINTTVLHLSNVSYSLSILQNGVYLLHVSGRVISASANNEYHLKVASDNEWPQFVINHGFSSEEFQVWEDKNNFFKGQDLERIEYYTSRIPNELRMVLESRDAVPTNATLDEVLLKYTVTHAQVFRAQQELFDMNHLTTEIMKKRGIHAVTLMLLGLDVSKEDYKMNQQLMFEEEKKLYPITPLVKDLLEILLAFGSTRRIGCNLSYYLLLNRMDK